VSFLIDPPWLYANGRAYGAITRQSPDQKRDALFLGGTMAAFWGVSGALYLEQPWTKPLWRLCRASSGRDWMLNSGVLRIDARRSGTATHVASALIFATYPYWLWRGLRAGRGRR
jgi:hypothetical protein